MDYSLNHLIAYVKTNWKHLLAGVALAYVGKKYGPAGTAKASAILSLFGLM